MCKNAVQTAGSLLAAVEPTLKSLLSYLNLAGTPEGEAVIAAYDAALTAVQNWQSGTAADNALQLIGDFQTIFNTLPLPAHVMVLANIILAGVEAVIGILKGNSPVPAPVASIAAGAPMEHVQAMYQIHVAAQTEKNVSVLVPSFKRSLFHSPESQYKKTWNGAVAKNGFPAEMETH